MRTKLRELRAQIITLRAEGKHGEAWDLEKQANELEVIILKEEITFYLTQYLEFLECGNKTEIQSIRRLLHKKQLRLEGVL